MALAVRSCVGGVECATLSYLIFMAEIFARQKEEKAEAPNGTQSCIDPRKAGVGAFLIVVSAEYRLELPSKLQRVAF